MKIPRRTFLKLSAAAGTVAGLNSLTGRMSSLLADESAPRPMRLLILGGTGFTGPDQVRYALSRGHQVTVFNRGKTHPGELPKEVEQLIGDRNGQLAALKGREWDVVIDNPTTLPVWVRDAAQVLKGHVGRYVFISTISVYADNSKPGADEGAALLPYTGADAMKETIETVRASGFALYGPLKALAEQEAQRRFPGESLVIRPGLIVGPGDETDRFSYWPVRIDRGGTMLAPGKPTDPVQFIDARDLAEWTVRLAERRETGVYNATGPDPGLTMGEMLDGIKAALKADAGFVWADAKFLEEQKVAAWSDMPVWVPSTDDTAGFASVSIRRALEKGLTFRPLAETACDTLAWVRAQAPARQGNLKAGLKPEREAEVLAAWAGRKAGR